MFRVRSEFKLTIIQAQTQSMRTRSKSRPELSIGPLACYRNRPCVRRKELEKRRGSLSKTVELGGFVFCLGLPTLIFLVFLEQRCSLKNRRASISRFSSAELSISTFSPPYSKAWKIRPAPLEFCGTFKRKLQRDASLVVQSANGSNKCVKCKFWMEEVGFRRTRPWKMELDFPRPERRI